MDDFFEAIFEGLFESVGDILEDLFDGLLEGIGEFLEVLFEGLFEGIGDFFEGFFESAGDFFEAPFDAIGAFFEGFFEGVGNFFKGIFSNLFEGSDDILESPSVDVAEISENAFGSFIDRAGDFLKNIFKHSSSDSFADLIGALVDDSGRPHADEKKEDYPVINEDYGVTSEYNSAFPIVEEDYEIFSPNTDSREEFSVISVFLLLFALLGCITASFFWILSGTN